MTSFLGVFINDYMCNRVEFSGVLGFGDESDTVQGGEFFGTFTLALGTLTREERHLFRRYAASEDTGLDLDLHGPEHGRAPILMPGCNGKGFSIEITQIDDSRRLPLPLKLQVAIYILIYVPGSSIAVEWRSYRDTG